MKYFYQSVDCKSCKSVWTTESIWTTDQLDNQSCPNCKSKDLTDPRSFELKSFDLSLDKKNTERIKAFLSSVEKKMKNKHCIGLVEQKKI